MPTDGDFHQSTPGGTPPERPLWRKRPHEIDLASDGSESGVGSGGSSARTSEDLIFRVLFRHVTDKRSFVVFKRGTCVVVNEPCRIRWPKPRKILSTGARTPMRVSHGADSNGEPDRHLQGSGFPSLQSQGTGKNPAMVEKGRRRSPHTHGKRRCWRRMDATGARASRPLGPPQNAGRRASAVPVKIIRANANARSPDQTRSGAALFPSSRWRE